MKPSLFLKLSHPLNRNFVPIKQSLPHFPPPILNCDQSLNLLILDLICKWNHTVFSFVSLLFHLTCCQGLSTLQHISNFIPVYGCIVCHCMYIYMLFIHLLMDMGLFLFFFKKTLVITAAVNIDIQIFESLLSVLLGTYLGVELLDQMVLFTYLRNQKVFFFSPALELGCCRQAFSSCSEQGLLSSCSAQASPCSGFSCCRVWAQYSWRLSLVAPWHVGSSWTRDQTCVPFIGRPGPPGKSARSL